MIGFTSIRDAITLAIGAGAMLAVTSLWDAAIDDPRVRSAAREAAIAEMRIQTQEAINEIQDRAERARVERRLCIDSGGVFDFATGRCRDG